MSEIEGYVTKLKHLRGTGRWIVEAWYGTDDEDEDRWAPTIYIGIPLDFAMEMTGILSKRPEHRDKTFRCRDADTGDVLLGIIL